MFLLGRALVLDLLHLYILETCTDMFGAQEPGTVVLGSTPGSIIGNQLLVGTDWLR